MIVDEIERLRSRIIENAREWCRAENIKPYKLALLSGFSGDSATRHMNRPDWSPTNDTLRAIEAILPKRPRLLPPPFSWGVGVKIADLDQIKASALKVGKLLLADLIHDVQGIRRGWTWG